MRRNLKAFGKSSILQWTGVVRLTLNQALSEYGPIPAVGTSHRIPAVVEVVERVVLASMLLSLDARGHENNNVWKNCLKYLQFSRFVHLLIRQVRMNSHIHPIAVLRRLVMPTLLASLD